MEIFLDNIENVNAVWFESPDTVGKLLELWKNPHGGMNYQYSLYVYDENGNGKDMALDTSRVLRDKAFIRIETAPMRGVIGWAEMLYEELPAAVQEKYTN